jgi:sialate O-acetylesterase
MKTLLNIFKFVLLLFVLLSCNLKNEENQLILPSVFSDHMVLQQKTDVVFWGRSRPNEKIIISGSWGDSNSIIADDTGEWELKLPTPSAGGPFEVDVSSSYEMIKYEDVLIGEVWLASGQSNMVWKLNQCEGCIDNQEEEIANANYNEIRFFNNPMDLSRTVVKSQKWRPVTSEYAGEMEDAFSIESFSAAGYFFARELYNELSVPIGIIGSSWGGTRVEAWTSRNKLSEITSVKLPLISQKHLSIKDYEELQEYYKKYNDSVAKVNYKLFGFQSFDLPRITIEATIEENWEKLNLNDQGYSKFNYDDSSWNNWKNNYYAPGYEELKGRFENIFDPKDFLLTNGTIWFRTEIELNDISSDYELIFEKGADDTDQTYFNGVLIGNTFSWSKERRYFINKSLLKKGKNILAIRISDLDGPGGFNGRILLKNDKSKNEILMKNFKYKHQAFLLDGKLLVHNLNDEELIEKSEYFKENIIRGFAVDTPNEYSILFDRILSNVLPYTIKGSIWYQGEANVINYDQYQNLFSAMIDDWRENWGYDFPFYYVQIAPYTEEGNVGVREAQRKTLQKTKKTGMVVLMDIGERDDIHPHNKQDVGKRLALLALDKDYGFNFVSSGPLYKKHEAEGKFLYVDFDSKGSGLKFMNGKNGFEIAGMDNRFFPATAEIVDNKIKIYSNNVKNPKNVRYGWKNWTVGTLFNNEGLPASSFSSID